MISQIPNLPANMVGFRASGDVNETDFTNTVMPKVKELVAATGKLNYMLVLDTELKNFTIGAWLQDAIMGLKHITKWNRAAIVCDTEAVRTFTSAFSMLMPGEFKGFEHKDEQLAIDWASEKVNLK